VMLRLAAADEGAGAGGDRGREHGDAGDDGSECDDERSGAVGGNVMAPLVGGAPPPGCAAIGAHAG
jgi:hypothetical protein